MRIASTLLLHASILVSFALGVGACGSKATPVNPPPEATATAAATTEATAEPTAAPTATGSSAASAAPTAAPSAAPPKHSGGGRPAVLFPGQNKVSSTFGSTPASILKVSVKELKDPVVLYLPEWALPTGYNITLEAMPKVTGKKPQLGPVFQLVVQEPG